jgi:hypothetical protein
MRRLIALIMVVIGTTIPRGGGTLAALTSSAGSAGHVFSTGTLDLGKVDAGFTTLTTTSYPGLIDYATVTLTNPGATSVDLRYSITSQVTEGASTTAAEAVDLAGQIQVSIVAVANVAACTSTAFLSTLLATDIPLNGTAASGNLLGDPTRGFQTGDQELTKGSTEVLCFRIALRSDAKSSVQGKQVLADLRFIAEQKATTEAS